MPTYEYLCTKGCASLTTQVKGVEQRNRCPKCCVCGAPTNRSVSSTSFILKGDGWPGQEIKRNHA